MDSSGNNAYGNVMQILKKWNNFVYFGYHMMLITVVDTDDFLYTARTSNVKDKNLSTGLGSYNSSNYKVKFFGMW